MFRAAQSLNGQKFDSLQRGEYDYYKLDSKEES